MHRALCTLLKLRGRGAVRRLAGKVKTRGGAIVTVLMIAFIALCLVPSLIMGITTNSADPDLVRKIAPIVLLALCVGNVVTSVGNHAIAFSLSEVDFLFAGPFTRRDLLTYKLVNGAAQAGAMALWFSVFLYPHVDSWLSGFVGLWLSLEFIQLTSMAVVLIRQIVSKHAYTRARRAVLLAVGVLIAWGLVRALSGPSASDVPVMFERFRTSWPGLCLFGPFEAFARTMTAQTLVPGLLGWGTLALLINGALAAVVIKLDANYLEAALTVSQKMHERRQRAKRFGGGIAVTSSTACRRLPRFPWAGGAGPIAWRRLTHALRTSRAGLLLLLTIALVVGGLAFTGRMNEQEHAWVLIGGLAYAMFIGSRIFPFDFRGELDHMDSLKTLPLGPLAITAGELAAPVLIATAFQTTACGLAAAFAQEGRFILLAAMAYSLPFNVLFFGIDNLIFLLFPVRIAVGGSADFQQAGRHMLTMLVQILVLAACLATAAAAGAGAYFIGDHSRIAFVAASWITLAGLSAAGIPCVAWAYRRFDPSTHTPP